MSIDTEPHDHEQTRGNFPVLILPRPSHIFLDRSRRFAALAHGHSLADWLIFLGRLTQVQHVLLQEYQSHLPPDEAAQDFARKQHLPPISALSQSHDHAWRQALTCLAREMAPHAPPPAREALEKLQTMDGPLLETLADRVLLAELDGEGADLLPFIAAALQVHWTALAAGLNGTEIAPLGMQSTCPCCGYLPVAGVIRVDGDVARLRYLHCALCNTEWHLVRVTCAACLDGNSIAYYHIEDSDGSVRAETCDSCRNYLKIVSREKSPQADPVADDLATLGLDLHAQEMGYARMSPNLLF